MPRRNTADRMMLPRLRPATALAALAFSLLGCGADYTANTYNAAAVQQANKVERGVIVGFREVAVSAEGTIGAVTGGAAGGIAASQSPLGPVSRAFSALGGTLVGGLVGSAAERAVGDTRAWEYIVREPSGELVSVTQADKVPLPIGQSVLVITGKQARVVPDYTVRIPEPAKLEPVRPEPAKTPAGAVRAAELPPLVQLAPPPAPTLVAPATPPP
jgi:outer membrane lipoprotein SlyB